MDVVVAAGAAVEFEQARADEWFVAEEIHLPHGAADHPVGGWLRARQSWTD